MVGQGPPQPRTALESDSSKPAFISLRELPVCLSPLQSLRAQVPVLDLAPIPPFTLSSPLQQDDTQQVLEIKRLIPSRIPSSVTVLFFRSPVYVENASHPWQTSSYPERVGSGGVCLARRLHRKCGQQRHLMYRNISEASCGHQVLQTQH